MRSIFIEREYRDLSRDVLSKVHQDATVGGVQGLEQQERDARERDGRTRGSGDDHRVEEARGSAHIIR